MAARELRQCKNVVKCDWLADTGFELANTVSEGNKQRVYKGLFSVCRAMNPSAEHRCCRAGAEVHETIHASAHLSSADVPGIQN